MTDENGEVLVSATSGVDPDIECEADVDVTFGKNYWTHIRIKVEYSHFGFDGWMKYRVRMHFCTDKLPSQLLDYYDIYIYGKQGMLLMTKFIFAVKGMIKANDGLIAVGAINIFRGRMQDFCYELKNRVRLFNNNYHNAVTNKLVGDGEVILE